MAWPVTAGMEDPKGTTMAGYGTEEDLRARVISYLSDLGVSTHQVRFEGLVRLQLGGIPIELGSDPEERMARYGHYDLLVVNDAGKNLLLAELKRPGLSLTTNDTIQAINYARLLTQMPPLAWLTNGVESHLYDVWSGLEIKGEELVSRWSDSAAWLSVVGADDLRLREEALRFFIGYSQENVGLFCHAQQKGRMATLRGEAGTRERKYIPEVYVRRRLVRTAFSDFLVAPAPVFALAGESGIGKTNELCALAEESRSAHLALFLSGGELSEVPGKVLADEFNWGFSDQLSLPRLCERLATLVRGSNRRVLVFIDGIDECQVPLTERAVSDLALHFAKYDGLLKLVVSLKLTQWERFSRVGDGPSHLARLCFKRAELASSSGQLERTGNVPSIELRPMDSDEHQDALSKYSRYFGLRGRLAPEIAARVRDPFELRVVSELCADGSRLLESVTGDDVTLLTRYLDEKLDKVPIARRSTVWRALEVVGAALWNVSTTARSHEAVHSVTERVALADGVGTGWCEIPREAFDLGLLVGEHGSTGGLRVSFQYDRVRDHVLAFRVWGIDALSPEDFRAGLEEWVRHPLGRTALLAYLNGGVINPHQEPLREYGRTCATRFLNTYAAIRQTLGSHLRSRVSPCVEGAVGLVYSLEGAHSWSYGLFAVQTGEERIVETENLLSRLGEGPRRLRDEPLSRVDGAWSTDAWPLLTQPEECAAARALDQVQNAVAGGALDEADGDVLDMEKVFAIVGGHRSALGFKHAGYSRSPAATQLGFDLLPLNLDDLRRRVHGELGARQTNWAVAPNRRSQGELVDAMKRVRQEASEGRRFYHPDNVRPVPPLAVLAEVLDRLLIKEAVLEKHYLPEPNVVWESTATQTADVEDEYDDNRVCELIARVWVRQVECCAWLVERNLPAWRNLFPSSALPHHVLVLYRRPREPGQVTLDGTLLHARLEMADSCPIAAGGAHAAGPRSRVQVYVQSESLRVLSGESIGIVGALGGAVQLHHGYGVMGFSRLLAPVNPVPLGWRGEIKHYTMPLRNYAYSKLREELKNLTAASILEAARARSTSVRPDPAGRP